jgi:hypothetical protein
MWNTIWSESKLQKLIYSLIYYHILMLMQGGDAYQNIYQLCQVTHIYKITLITFTKRK